LVILNFKLRGAHASILQDLCIAFDTLLATRSPLRCGHEMKTAEELMPGGRWLSVPGTDYESAFYALAVGLSTSPGLLRPLNWSQHTPERAAYNALIKLWMAETIPPYRHPRDEITFQPVMFRALISVWNHSKRSGHYLELQEKNGEWKSLGSGYVTSWSTAVLVRQVNNRWECFGYFSQELSQAIKPTHRFASAVPRREPALRTNGDVVASPRVSDQVSALILSKTPEASSTLSAIVHIETKPVNGSKRPTDPRGPNSRFVLDPFENKPIESMAGFLRGALVRLNDPILKLSYWITVVGVSKAEAVRPTVGRLCSEICKAGFTAIEILERIDTAATSQEKKIVSAKMDGYAELERKLKAKQQEMDAAEQKGDENVEQKGDGAEQKGDNGTEQKEDEGPKQRKRKEAEAAAAKYAAQDRYDSCSDSD
ncbi:hypothetical protein KCU67_g204, partial [Aureobasidium melanogenum]